jgi:hypothetical protein
VETIIADIPQVARPTGKARCSNTDVNVILQNTIGALPDRVEVSTSLVNTIAGSQCLFLARFSNNYDVASWTMISIKYGALSALLPLVSCSHENV